MAKAWKETRATRCRRLRNLLKRAWHEDRWLPHAAMTDSGGSRFGARLEEIRNGWDGGPPWLVEVRGLGTTSPEYRYAGPNREPRPKPTPKVRRECPMCGARLRRSPDEEGPAAFERSEAGEAVTPLGRSDNE